MNVEKIREMYPEGTQIILQEMRGDLLPLTNCLPSLK